MTRIKNLLNSPKRIAAFIICAILVIAIVAFSAIKVGASIANNQGIGLEKATQIALQNAGYKESEVSGMKGHYDKDEGIGIYEIEFFAGGYEYDYDIKASDGTIISVDREATKSLSGGSATTENGQSSSGNSASGSQQPSQSQGGGQSQSGSQSQNNNQSQGGNQSANQISVEKAKSIALSAAGVSSSNATFHKAELDFDDGAYVYDIEFVSGNYEYDYEINANSGAILKREIEQIKSTGSSNTTISADKAKSIALNHAGVSSSKAVFNKAKLDNDDGIHVYEIEFTSGGYEYEYEINAANGTILSYDHEHCDDDDHHGHDH